MAEKIKDIFESGEVSEDGIEELTNGKEDGENE